MTNPSPPPTPKLNQPFPTLWVMMLGVMIAIGPLAIDMYLPALPSMAKDLGTTTESVSRSIPAYFVGLVFGQLFYGPWSDRVGRVLPLYVGMTIFVLASMLCAMAQSEWALFVGRTLQALGACVTAVVSRAATRDVMTPVQMAKAFSLMVLVMGIAPILAPSLGALVLKFFEWRALFWLLAGYGIFNMILAKLFLKETLKEEFRNYAPASQTLKGYGNLLKDKRFLTPAVAGGLLQGAFFIYLSISSALFMEGYHLSEQQFAIAFGANAFGFIAMTQLNQFLTRRYHLVQLFRFGACWQLVAALALLIMGLTMGLESPFWAVFGSIFCCVAGLGLTQPNAGAIALAHQKHRAGMASATQGALTFSVGIFGGFVLSLINTNMVLKLALAITVLVSIGTFLAFRLNRHLRFD